MAFDINSLWRVLGGQTNTGMPPESPLQAVAQRQGQAMNLQAPDGMGQFLGQNPVVQPTTSVPEQPTATSVQPQSSVGNPLVQQPQSSLSGGLTPEQASVGAAMANTPAEADWWRQVVQNLTGNSLQGQPLQDWQKNMAGGTFLASLGHAIGGDDTFGGRLGKGVEGFGQGSIAGKNAELSEGALYNLLSGMGRATAKPQAPQATQSSSTATQTSSSTPGAMPTTNTTSKLAEDMIRYLGI